MNIIVISSKYPPEYSGSGLRAHNTYKRLISKYDINVKVLSSSIVDNSNKKYVIDGIEILRIAQKVKKYNSINRKVSIKPSRFNLILTRIKSKLSYYAEALLTIKYLIKNYLWIDIIHVFGNVSVTSAAITFAKITRKPIMIELVNLVEKPSYYESKVLSLFYEKGYPNHATMVAISQALADACLSIGIDKNKIWCRPNPIDEKKFNLIQSLNNPSYKEVHEFDSNSFVILHLAKFMPRKKQEFMVEVLAKLPDQYKLILAGPLVDSGPLVGRDIEYYHSIIGKIKRNGLSTRVKTIAEFVDHPERLIKHAKVFVLPSVMEGLGTPILEALACGVPVVANDIPGVFDKWVHNGINGFVCELDAELWAEKIMMAAKISSTKMRKASAEVLEVASTEVIDAEYYRRFNEILN